MDGTLRPLSNTITSLSVLPWTATITIARKTDWINASHAAARSQTSEICALGPIPAVSAHSNQRIAPPDKPHRCRCNILDCSPPASIHVRCRGKQTSYFAFTPCLLERFITTACASGWTPSSPQVFRGQYDYDYKQFCTRLASDDVYEAIDCIYAGICTTPQTFRSICGGCFENVPGMGMGLLSSGPLPRRISC